MPVNLKDTERELIRLVTFFKKRADKLIKEGKLSAEHEQVIIACDRLVDTLHVHAANRSQVLEQREMLKTLVKDNAECPRCGKSSHLKLMGIDRSEQGWRNNKYRCRRCNIEFVWNRPNNPWDMLPFIEDSIRKMAEGIQAEPSEEIRQQSEEMIGQMQGNLEKLRPVIETSDVAYKELQERDEEIARMVHEFKNYLLIEKIKMDTWPGSNGNSNGHPGGEDIEPQAGEQES